MHCSTSAGIFALCAPDKKDCLTRHKSDQALGKKIVAFGKRKETAPRKVSPPKAHQAGPSGSHSGAVPSWDAQHFPFKRRRLTPRDAPEARAHSYDEHLVSDGD